VLIQYASRSVQGSLPHGLVMNIFDMSVEIWPTITGYITAWIWAIVSKQKYSIFKDVNLLIFNTKTVVNLRKSDLAELLVSLARVVCEYHKLGIRLTKHHVNSLYVPSWSAGCSYSTMCTSFGFVQCSQTQCADVAGPMITK